MSVGTIEGIVRHQNTDGGHVKTASETIAELAKTYFLHECIDGADATIKQEDMKKAGEAELKKAGLVDRLMNLYTAVTEGMTDEQVEKISDVASSIVANDPKFGICVLNIVGSVKPYQTRIAVLNIGKSISDMADIDKKGIFNKMVGSYIKSNETTRIKSPGNTNLDYILSLKTDENPIAKIEGKYGSIKNVNYTGGRLEIEFAKKVPGKVADTTKMHTISIPIHTLDKEKTAYVRGLVEKMKEAAGNGTARMRPVADNYGRSLAYVPRR